MGFNTAVVLPSYEEGTFDATFSGPFDVDQTITLVYRKIGKMVVLEVPAIAAAAHNPQATTTTVSTILPVTIAPAATVEKSVSMVKNSAEVNQVGKFEIFANRDIKMSCDLVGTGGWGTAGNVGWTRFTVCYTTA